MIRGPFGRRGGVVCGEPGQQVSTDILPAISVRYRVDGKEGFEVSLRQDQRRIPIDAREGFHECRGVELLVHKRLDERMFDCEDGAIASSRDYLNRAVYPLLNPIGHGGTPVTAVAGRKQHENEGTLSWWRLYGHDLPSSRPTRNGRRDRVVIQPLAQSDSGQDAMFKHADGAPPRLRRYVVAMY